MVNQICSVIFGGCGIIANATIYQQKKRQKILWFKLVSNILWSAHYLFLFAYAGMGVCLIGVVRESIFINKDKKWAKSKIWLVIFLFLNIITGIITWKNIFNLLPCVAGVVSVISFWIGEPKITRWLAFPISIMFLTYDVIIRSYAGIINEIILLFSVIVGIFRFKRKEKITK